jgi:hypothetical protein
MEKEAWGVKWGAYDQAEPVVVEDRVDYRFTCAWSIPAAWLQTASAKWPKLLFLVSWGGEGPSRGRVLYANGARLVLADDDGDDVDLYIDSHADWIGYTKWAIEAVQASQNGAST